MAEINVGVNKTNDPSYLGNSQGTDKATLQPLATVPELSTKYVTPDYKANTTAGQAIKGIGELGDAAIKLTDAVIQKKADDTLTEGIQKIRDEFGVGAAAKMGAEGDTTGDKATLLTGDSNTPVAVNRLGNRIEKLTEQYQQGGLSNSAYYAKMEAFVRQTKEQFPGYHNEIDTMVATKTGTTPANALRSSLLNDVTALQGKVASLSDKRTTYEHQNQADITTAFGAQYWTSQNRPPISVVEARVSSIQAQDAGVKRDRANLGLVSDQNGAASSQAEDFAMRIGSSISQRGVTNLTNNMGIKGTQDLKDYLESVQNGTRKPPTPEEADTLRGVFATMKAQVTNAYHQEMNKPTTEGGTRTPASILRDKTKYNGGLELALSGITTIEDSLLNEKHGTLASTVQYNQAKLDFAQRQLLTASPNTAIVAGLNKLWGENALKDLVINGQTGVAGDMITLLQRAGWEKISKGEPAIDFIKSASKDDPSGVASNKIIKEATYAIQNPEKVADKRMVDGAFKTMFGEGNAQLIEAFKNQPGLQVRVFTDMVDPKTTAAMAKRPAADQQQYGRWAERSFSSVFQVQAQGINAGYNDAAKNGRLELSFNPKTETFEYVPKKLSVTEKMAENITGKPPGLPTGAANNTLVPINAAFASMKPVLKMQGKTMTEFVGQQLPQLGISPDSPVWKAYIAGTVTETDKGKIAEHL